MAEKFIIRKAVKEDIKKVFELSNDEIVRQNSINKNKVEWENHEEWFNKRIKNKDEHFYIAETPEGDFIGQIRIENKNSENEISVSITKKYRGKGLCAEILKASIQKSGLKKVTAHIYDYNQASIRSFEKAGFKNSHLLKYELTPSL